MKKVAGVAFTLKVTFSFLPVLYIFLMDVQFNIHMSECAEKERTLAVKTSYHSIFHQAYLFFMQTTLTPDLLSLMPM